MSWEAGWLRRHARRGGAALAVVSLFAAARLPELSPEERSTMAQRFRFVRLPLPEHGGRPPRTVREVHPSLQRIAAWISSVGAAIAVADLDGDGLPNDMCHVDPRTDTVLLAPLPGTSPRFAPVVLEPAPVRYDANTMAPMGCLTADVDEDGKMDVIVYYWGRPPIAFLRNSAGYTPVDIVPGEERWFTNAATLADLDGDTHLDLIVANYFQDGARVLDAHDTGEAQTMQDSMSRAYNSGRKHVLIGKGGSAVPAIFEEARSALDDEVDRGWTLAVGASDLDGDLLPELYFANDFGPDRLLHNRSTPGHLVFSRLEGERTAGTPASKVLGRDSFKGMGVDFGDLNGDGTPDMIVSNIATEYGLLESHFAFVSTGDRAAMRRGVAPYVDRSEPLGLSRSGWGWDIKFADLDNDGQLEVLQATGFVRGEVNRWPELQELATGNDELLHDVRAWPRFQLGDDLSGWQRNPFFARSGDRFVDISRELGLDQPHVTRGIALADVDGDGDLDYAIANQWEASFFHRNDCDPCGSFLGLHLRWPVRMGEPASTEQWPGHPDDGTPSRPAIGATATVFLPDGRRLVGQVDGGNGHSGKRSPDLHFGLGDVRPGTTIRVDLAYRDPAGATHRETLRIAPGWHTVRLGWPVSGGAEQ